MTVSASVDVKLSAPTLNQIDLLKLLLSHGWCIYDNGSKVYLPINDNDMFNWQWDSQLCDAELLDILYVKQSLDELIGVSLSWQDTNIGGEFLIFDDLSISVIFSNNRKINEYGVTDFNWYLSKIIPAIDIEGILIDSINFTQIN